MPRSLSSLARSAVFAAQTGECFLILLELTHPDMAEPILVSSDAVNTLHGGDTYQAFPFSISMPAESDDAPPRVVLAIDAIDRTVIQAVRGLAGEPITATTKIVLGSTPDQVEAGPFEFKIREVEYDALVVTGQLQYADLGTEPYPGDTFSLSTTPGIF